MSKFTISTIAAGLALIASGAANAQSSFDVKFIYKSNATAEKNYERFERKAERACRIAYRAAAFQTNYANLISDCETELMNKIIDKADRAELTSIHREKSPSPSNIRLADLN